MDLKEIPLTQRVIEERQAILEQRRKAERNTAILPFLRRQLEIHEADSVLACGFNVDVSMTKPLLLGDGWDNERVQEITLKLEARAFGNSDDKPRINSEPLRLSLILDGPEGCTEVEVASLISPDHDDDTGLRPPEGAEPFTPEEQEFLIGCIEEAFETSF